MQKVRVSETPGKTKHFQTLPLTEDITLCDCPGLVMPSIANSKAGMVLQVIDDPSIDQNYSLLTRDISLNENKSKSHPFR